MQTLQKLGIDARVRTVDPAQYQHLTDDFDFDMIMMIYPEGDMPGNELRDYFTCAAAKAQGSMNAPGICDPAVDALMQNVIAAQDRDSLRGRGARAGPGAAVAMVHGAELAQQEFHVAWWNRFGQPGKPIREGFNFDTWWVDADQAKATDAARH